MRAPAGHATGVRPDTGAARWPRLPRAFVVSAALLVAVAGPAGWAAHRLRAPSAPPSAPAVRAVDLGAVALSVPGSWASVPVGDVKLPGLGARAAAYAPIPGLSGYAVVMLAPFGDATLLPAAARGLAGPGPPRRTKLAGLPAWRYREHGPADGRAAQVTVAPTTAGSLTVVCVAKDAAWPGVQGCAADVANTVLRDATPLVPSPTLVLRRELAPVLSKLNRRRGPLRAKLRAATTRRGQARFAGRLGTAHRRGLAALTRHAPATGAPRRVVTELRRTARSYGRLAVAARHGWPGRYRQARVAIRRSDRALAAAVAAVR
jgi:hypothetical protein